MIDENNTEVVENVTPETGQEPAGQEEVTQPEQASTGEPEATVEVKKEPDEHVKQVQNWRALREKAERAERERDEAVRALQEKGVHQPKSVDEDNFSVNDDDLLEGKHLKKYEQRQTKRLAQIEQRLIEQQIRTQYPDFDKVVTSDTLGMLRDADPELAESILSNKNVHSQAISAYRSIKRFGFAPEDKYTADKEKIAANSTKPKPVSSINPQQGESPLSKANAFAGGLTADLKKQLWEEMQACKKQK
jgi:hypothetical protein